MSCPTCANDRLQQVGVMPPPYEKVPLFWCGRCGTLRANVVTEEDEVPKDLPRLVDALRELHDFGGITVDYRYRERSRQAFQRAAALLELFKKQDCPV